MSTQQSPYSLRVSPELMEKAKVIAKEHGRSLNKEIEVILKEAVKDYEAAYGPIQICKQSD